MGKPNVPAVLGTIAFDVHERHLHAQALATLRRTLLVVALLVGNIVAAIGVPSLVDLKLMSRTQPTTLISQDKPSNKIGEKCRDAPPHIPAIRRGLQGPTKQGHQRELGNTTPGTSASCESRQPRGGSGCHVDRPHAQHAIGVAVSDAVHENRHWATQGCWTPPQLGGPRRHGTTCHSRMPPQVRVALSRNHATLSPTLHAWASWAHRARCG